MHTHLPPDNVLRLTAHFGLLYLAHGVTTVRDAGDIDDTAIPAARKLVGPLSSFFARRALNKAASNFDR